MATENSKKLVQNMYIAYYGRPADSEGLEYWASETDTKGLQSILDAFGTSPEYTKISNNLDNSALINRLFQFLFNRDAEEAGLNFYLDKLEATTDPWSLSTIAFRIFDGALNDDKKTIDNKVELADYFTTQHDPAKTKYDLDGVQALRTVVDKVTADASGLATLKSEIDQYVENNAISSVPPPEPEPKVIFGTDGDDTITVANHPAKQSFDLGAGGDRLIVTPDPTKDSPLSNDINEFSSYKAEEGDSITFDDGSGILNHVVMGHVLPFNIDGVDVLTQQGVDSLHIEDGLLKGQQGLANVPINLSSWSEWETLITNNVLDLADVYTAPSVEEAKTNMKDTVFGFHFEGNTVLVQLDENRQIESTVAVPGEATHLSNFDFFPGYVNVFVDPTAF